MSQHAELNTIFQNIENNNILPITINQLFFRERFFFAIFARQRK